MKGFPNKVSGYPHPLSKTLQNGQPSKVHAILLAWHAEMRKKGEPSSLFPSPCLLPPAPHLAPVPHLPRIPPPPSHLHASRARAPREPRHTHAHRQDQRHHRPTRRAQGRGAGQVVPRSVEPSSRLALLPVSPDTTTTETTPQPQRPHHHHRDHHRDHPAAHAGSFTAPIARSGTLPRWT